MLMKSISMGVIALATAGLSLAANKTTFEDLQSTTSAVKTHADASQHDLRLERRTPASHSRRNQPHRTGPAKAAGRPANTDRRTRFKSRDSTVAEHGRQCH